MGVHGRTIYLTAQIELLAIGQDEVVHAFVVCARDADGRKSAQKPHVCMLCLPFIRTDVKATMDCKKTADGSNNWTADTRLCACGLKTKPNSMGYLPNVCNNKSVQLAAGAGHARNLCEKKSRRLSSDG